MPGRNTTPRRATRKSVLVSPTTRTRKSVLVSPTRKSVLVSPKGTRKPLSLSPKTPGWSSGQHAIFKTPESTSPKRPRTRRSSMYQPNMAEKRVKLQGKTGQVESQRIYSPPVAKRTRRSSMYHKGGMRLVDIPLNPDMTAQSPKLASPKRAATRLRRSVYQKGGVKLVQITEETTTGTKRQIPLSVKSVKKAIPKPTGKQTAKPPLPATKSAGPSPQKRKLTDHATSPGAKRQKVAAKVDSGTRSPVKISLTVIKEKVGGSTAKSPVMNKSPSPLGKRKAPIKTPLRSTTTRTPVKSTRSSLRSNTPVVKVVTPVTKTPLQKSSVDMTQTMATNSSNSAEKIPVSRATVTRTKTPVAKAKSPVTKTKTPVAKAKSPVTKTKTPVAKAKSPVMKTKTPVVKAKSPVMKTKTPVAKAKSPVTKTKTPAAIAKTPVTKTKTPVAKAKSSVTKTKTPVAKTITPVTMAKTSFVKTKSPVTKTKTPVAKAKTPVAKTTTPAAKAKTPITKINTPAPTANTPFAKTNTPAMLKIPIVKTKTPDTTKTPVSKTKTPTTKSPVIKAKSVTSKTPVTKTKLIARKSPTSAVKPCAASTPISLAKTTRDTKILVTKKVSVVMVDITPVLKAHNKPTTPTRILLTANKKKRKISVENMDIQSPQPSKKRKSLESSHGSSSVSHKSVIIKSPSGGRKSLKTPKRLPKMPVVKRKSTPARVGETAPQKEDTNHAIHVHVDTDDEPFNITLAEDADKSLSSLDTTYAHSSRCIIL